MSGKFDRQAFIEKFVFESRENVLKLNRAFLLLEKHPSNTEAIRDSLRLLHTIKGSARMLNLNALGLLLHAMEEATTSAEKNLLFANAADIETLLQSLDRASSHLDEVSKDGQSNADFTEWLNRLEKISKNDIKQLEISKPQELKKPIRQVSFDRSVFIDRFLTEAEEHLQNLKKFKPDWVTKPEALENCVRSAHTLKGSARMMKFENVGNIAQRVEAIFRTLHKGTLVWKPGFLAALQITFSTLETLAATIRTTEKDTLDNTALLDALDQVAMGVEVDATHIKTVSPVEKNIVISDPKAMPTQLLGERLIGAGIITPTQLLHVNQTTDAKVPLGERLIALGYITRQQLLMALKEQRSSRELMGQRVTAVIEDDTSSLAPVRMEKLDKLIHTIGEMNSQHLRADEHWVTLRKIYESLRYEIMVLRRVSGQSAQVESLEIIAEKLSKQVKKSREDAAGLGLAVKELQAEIMTMRMAPIKGVFDGFPRAVRDLAKSLGKSVRLVIEGEETEMDRQIVESLNEPLVHLVRNAMDHGLESPEERAQKNKVADGVVRIAARHEGNAILIEVEDDGRGIDLGRIRAKALEKKIVADENAAQRLSDNDWLNMIFLPSFSTSEMITDISGRGYGMDVVKTRIESLKGAIEVTTEKNIGTRFSIRLPVTLTSMRALIVEAGGLKLGLPVTAVTETLKIRAGEIIQVVEKKAIRLRNQIIPVSLLSEIMMLPANDGLPADEFFVVIAHAQGERAGFIVDDILDERDILVKSLPKSMTGIRHVSSATVASDNEIILVLQVPDLLRASKDMAQVPTIMETKSTGRSILVVDDSLNTREIEKTILQAYGYLVETAKDGVDGLDKIRLKRYDLIITDLEMPVMDGLTLTSQIKADPSLKDIPVIIVTSRDSAEDKKRGIECGANAYIVKGSFDQTNLIDAVESLIG